MNWHKLSQLEKETLVGFVKYPMEFQYNSSNNKFEGNKGEIYYGISREMVEDLLCFNFVNFLFTREVSDLDEEQTLRELIVEDMCQIKWHSEHHDEHPEDAQYSNCVDAYCKFTYWVFANEMVDAIKEYFKHPK